MNLVGKIFTVLIFLMCVVFGTFALMVHATHKNWKVEVDKYNLQLTQALKEKQDLADEKKILETALINQKDQTQRRLIALKEAADTATRERNAMEGQLATKEDENRKLVLAIQAVHQTMSVLQKEIAGMREEIKVAVVQRDDLQTKLVKATDDLTNAAAERGRLEKLQVELAGQITKLRESLAYAQVPADIKALTSPSGLEGEVTSVPRPDVIEISVGADDGVRKGHQFVVTRPSTGKYIGVIEVIQVDYPNRAVCRPDKSRQTDQFQKGDHVKAITKSR